MAILSRAETAFANYCCLGCCKAGDLGDHDYCVDCDTNPICASGRSRDYGYDYSGMPKPPAREKPVAVVDEKKGNKVVQEKPTPAAKSNAAVTKAVQAEK